MDGNQPNPAPILAVPSDEQAARLAWLKEHIKKQPTKLMASAHRPARPGSIGVGKFLETRVPCRLGSPFRRLMPDPPWTNGAALGCPSGDAITIPEGVPASGCSRDCLSAGAARHSAPSNLSSRQGRGPASAHPTFFAVGEVQAEIIPAAEGEAEVKPRKIEFAFAAADAEEKGHEAARLLDGNAESTWILPGPRPTALLTVWSS